ncbi:hypothetical protein TCAL_10541 [Tigriopus californicus]|uniref:NYN domain-containing protein n=1 Tax=Tigriopus californicus TaxID=6832 RepID=A0A553PHP3_TIGCA|nr:meiosis regulator and mRNA stability factor 1-like [Tigriopus californicus]TRY77194.1 hypothetical protein TCAL_10541 [Tigriopus californicus]
MASASTPPEPTVSPSASSDTVGVFWDIQNCSVPRGKSACKVVDRVRELPWLRGKAEHEFVVVCDVTQMHEDTLHELNQSQVCVQHVSAAKKNSADEKLRQNMNKFVDLFGRRATLVVISGDTDFLGDLSDFRRRKGVTVVLLHNRQTNEFLLNVANVKIDFNALLEDIPKSNSTSPFTFNELEITQLPSPCSMHPKVVKQRLEDICQAHQGKLKLFISDQRIAVLKFDQGDKTTKALHALRTNSYGLYGLQVDYNKRGFNRAKTLSASPSLDLQPQFPPHLPTEIAKTRPIAKVTAVNSYVQSMTATAQVLEPNQLMVTKDVNSDLRRVSSNVMELQKNSQHPPDLSKLSPMARRRMQILEDSRGLSPSPANNGAKKKKKRQRSRRSQSRQSSRSRTHSGTSEESGESRDVLVEEFRALGIGSCPGKIQVVVTVLAPDLTSAYVESYLSQCLGLDLTGLKKSQGQWSVTSLLSGIDEVHRVQELIQKKPDGMSVKILHTNDKHYRQSQVYALVPEKGNIPWNDIKSQSQMFLTFDEVKAMSDLIVVQDLEGEYWLERAHSDANDGPRLILPTVLTTLSKLKDRLQKAFWTHNNNIPFDSMLDALNTKDPNDPIPILPAKQGGVPLEQLLNALDMSEVVHGIHGRAFVCPKGEKPKPNAKNPGLAVLERKFLHVLELTPFHRMVWETDFYESFYVAFQERLNDVCAPFGGVENVLDQLKDTFRLIGMKEKAEITLNIHYQKRVFMIALRKVLASQPPTSLRRGMSVEPKALAPLFEARLKKPFRVNDFGVCTVEDLLEIMLKSKQNLFHLAEGRLHFKDGILSFLTRSASILSRVDGYSCSVEEFNRLYTQAYGAYSIANMSFKSLKDLCSEFMHELEFSPGNPGSPDRISLSKQQKLRHLKATVCQVVKGSQEHLLPLDQLHAECMNKNQYDLTANLAYHGLDLPSLAKSIGNETDWVTVACSGKKVALAWNNGQWLERFQKRIVFLLFHCPGRRIRITLLERLFTMTYGGGLFLSLAQVEDMLKGPDAILFAKEVSGEKIVQLHEKGVILACLATLVPKSNGKLQVANVPPTWRARYDQVMAGWSNEELAKLVNFVPGVLTFNEGFLTLDPEGSQFFLTLPKPNVMDFMEQVVRDETATLKASKGPNSHPKPSRMAASFSPGMR